MNSKIAKIKNLFKDLRFDEGPHSYFVKGEKLKLSVSGVIKAFVQEVKFENIAKATDIKNSMPTGATQKLWDLKKEAACSKGDRAHYWGELYAFHRHLEPDSGLELAIKNFWDSLPEHIVPAFTELEMYHFKKMFGGTADIILYNKKTGKFIIADYKTNEDIWKNFKKKTLTGCFDFLLDNPFNKYQIQFSLYQVLFEQTGYEVEKRILIWVKPDGSREEILTTDYTDIVKEYLETAEI